MMGTYRFGRSLVTVVAALALTGLTACSEEVSEDDIICQDLGDDNDEQYACGVAKGALAPMIDAVMADDPSSLSGVHAVRTFDEGGQVECGTVPMTNEEPLLAAWCYGEGYIGVDVAGVIESVVNDDLIFIRASFLWALTTRVVEDTPLDTPESKVGTACKAGHISNLMVVAGSLTPDEATAMRNSLFGNDDFAPYFLTDDLAGLSDAFDGGYRDGCFIA